MIRCSTHCCQSDALRFVANVCDGCHCQRMSKEIQHQARISSASTKSLECRCRLLVSETQWICCCQGIQYFHRSTALLRSDALSSHQCKERSSMFRVHQCSLCVLSGGHRLSDIYDINIIKRPWPGYTAGGIPGFRVFLWLLCKKCLLRRQGL